MLKIKGLTILFCVFFLMSTFSAISAKYKHFYHEVSEHFRNACLINEFSKSKYINYFENIGANVQFPKKKNIPFSMYVSIEDKDLISTFYDSPAKCCISVINVESEQFVGWMMEFLPLAEPVGAKVNSEKSIMVFKPRYTNRSLTIDSYNTSKGRVINLCRTDNSNALQIYSKYLNNIAPSNR